MGRWFSIGPLFSGKDEWRWWLAMKGGMGLGRKIAYVNLRDGSYEIGKIPMEWRKNFLGGR